MFAQDTLAFTRTLYVTFTQLIRLSRKVYYVCTLPACPTFLKIVFTHYRPLDLPTPLDHLSGTAPIFAAVVFLALLLRGQVRRKRLAHHGSVLGPRRYERPITFPGLAFAVTLAVFASFQRLERNQFTFIFRCARVPVIFFPASPFSEVFCRLALPHTAAGEALDIPLVTQVIAFDVLRLALSFLTPNTSGL